MNKLLIPLLAILFSCSGNSENKGSKITNDVEGVQVSVVDSLSSMIISDPENSNYYYRRALYYYDEEEYSLASDDIQRALVIDSTVAEYNFVQANIYYDELKIKDAFLSYQKVIEYDSEHEGALLKLSQIELILRNYDLAIEMVNKALKIDPMNPKAYYLKGLIYLDSKDTSTAVSSFQTAIEVDPEHYDSYIALGNVWLDRDPAFSESYYNQALEIRPESVEALYSMGVLLQKEERYVETYPIYNKILSIDSSAYFAYYNKGYVLLVSDSSYKEAITEFEYSLLYYPYYHQAYYNIGLCFENLGDYGAAEKNYRKALEIDNQYEPAAFGLSRILE